jgi:MFS transporter, DHA1 family, tetracycline resistance protein
MVAMPKISRPLITIFLIVFIDLLGFGLILPLLPFIAERYHATPQMIGLLAATYSFFQFVSAPILGRLSDKYGRKKLLIISQFGTFVGFIILGFSTTLAMLFLSRIIDGITGGNISIAQAYIADTTDKKNRAQGMGLIGAAFGLGFVIGPVLGGYLFRYGFSVPAFFAAAISMLTMILTAIFLKESVSKENQQAAGKQNGLSELKLLFKNNNLVRFTTVFFVLNLAFSSFQGIFALWTQKYLGWTPQQIGYMFTYIGIIAVVTQIKILPELLKRSTEIKLTMSGLTLMAVSFIWLALSKSLFSVLGANTLIVIGSGLMGPTTQALATEEVKSTEHGTTMGIFQSFASVGRILGPILGGYLFAAHPNMPFFTAAAATAIGIGILFPMRRKAKIVHHD